jgi:hypothetical protein
MTSASFFPKVWTSVASSADGSVLIAADGGGGYLYTSSNSGSTWTQQTGSGARNWTGVAVTADGSTFFAVLGGHPSGYVYKSLGGAVWSALTNSGSRDWRSVAVSFDGTYLAAAVYGGYVYISSDGGANWTQRTGMGTGVWNSITMSADGTKIAVADNGDLSTIGSVYYSGGYIYTSSDIGVTWVQQRDVAQRWWRSIASSSNGKRLVAVVGTLGNTNGYIWTAIPQTVPTKAFVRQYLTAGQTYDMDNDPPGASYFFEICPTIGACAFYCGSCVFPSVLLPHTAGHFGDITTVSLKGCNLGSGINVYIRTGGCGSTSNIVNNLRSIIGAEFSVGFPNCTCFPGYIVFQGQALHYCGTFSAEVYHNLGLTG